MVGGVWKDAAPREKNGAVVISHSVPLRTPDQGENGQPESPKPALWGWERNGASDSCKPKYLCEWISVMTGMNA